VMATSNLSNDPIVQGFSKLTACNVSDALDRLHVGGAPHRILPLWPGCSKIVGPAITLKLTSKGSASPVQGTMQALSAARAGDVMVVDHGGRLDVNSWGGIATFTALKRGLAGAVIDGVTRDIDEIKAMEFPTYAKGIIQQSIRNRCAYGGHNVMVQLGTTIVRPGDLILADENGVVVVPRERMEEVLKIAQTCAAAEERLRSWIAQGMDPIEAHDRVKYERLTAGSPA
jgi:4-hydroxy-4-methyl-2-oxoglutarate aldolase